MGAFKIKKNGTVYENNKMPGAYPGERVTYDNTESGLTAENMQSAVDEVVEIKANKTDLTNISQSGATATQAISSGTYFYLDGTLVRAKTTIASGATFTLNTNYEVVTVGGLNEGIIYSTTEHKVGKWIDGSDLYEKTVDIGALPNNTYQGYSLGIPDGSVVRECVGYATTGNYFQPLEEYSNGNYTHWYIDTRSIFVSTNSDMSDWIGRVTVRYTKV